MYQPIFDVKLSSMPMPRHPNNAKAPACASIIDVPTGVPTLSENDSAAAFDKPFAIVVPGSNIFLPIN